MRCPHCTVEFHDAPEQIYVGRDVDGEWGIVKRTCPACRRIMLNMQKSVNAVFGMTGSIRTFAGLQAPVVSDKLVKPKGSTRPPCPTEVPRKFADDYAEGCLVLPDSPKSAAALGRRCLQNLLREAAGVQSGNLANEIQAVMDSGRLPSDLHESIDYIRNIGNFAAHPMKSQHSGQILDVAPGEAEWTLDALEALFDFYFVRPAKIKQMRDALNQKLSDAGKQPMK